MGRVLLLPQLRGEDGGCVMKRIFDTLDAIFDWFVFIFDVFVLMVLMLVAWICGVKDLDSLDN